MAFDSYTQSNENTFQSSIDSKGKITQTAVRHLQIHSDSPNTDNLETATTAFASQGIVHNSIHPHFGMAFRLKDLSVTQHGPYVYRAECTYRTPEIDSQNPSDPLPWNQPTKIGGYTIKAEEELDCDINGKPIVTKAGEKVRGRKRPVSDQGIRLTRAFLNYSSDVFYTYIDSVNSDTFLNFPPGTLRVDDISFEEETWEQGTFYYNVTVLIAARKPYNVSNERAWWDRVVNEGFYARPAIGEPPEPAVNPITKEPVSTPVLLDSDGVAVADVVPPNYPDATWIETEIFELRAFSGMGFF